jgi:cobalt-precorrin 5A hydrolase
MRLTVVVLTRAGLDLARRLCDGQWEQIALRQGGPNASFTTSVEEQRPFLETSILGPRCVVAACSAASADDGDVMSTAEPGVFAWRGPLRRVFPRIWAESDAVVAVMALGIVVRLAGPLACDKRHDPAVVVVDEAGQFAISVLGGHGSGANALARGVGRILGARPVITTGSEALGLPAVDLIGSEWGWNLERAQNLTRVAAAVVRRGTIGVYQDTGPPDWWRPFGSWPTNFVRLETWEDSRLSTAEAVLAITDSREPPELPIERTLVYRPRTLVVGIGCRRGTPRSAIAEFVERVFEARGLALGSLAAVATVTLKANEPGLREFAEDRGVPLIAYGPEELANQPGIETPSERVRAWVGIPAVAEPSALRGAGAAQLLVTKQVGPGITVAVARIEGEATLVIPRPVMVMGSNRSSPQAQAEPQRFR